MGSVRGPGVQPLVGCRDDGGKRVPSGHNAEGVSDPQLQGPLAREAIKRFRQRRNGTVQIKDLNRATSYRNERWLRQ